MVQGWSFMYSTAVSLCTISQVETSEGGFSECAGLDPSTFASLAREEHAMLHRQPVK